MAGIKQVYRSPDAFRFPTFDPLITYPVNSVVAHYDSDNTTWFHYISKVATTAGSLDSDIGPTQWIKFTFDSDTLGLYAEKAVKNNFDALVANVDSDFLVTLSYWNAQIDSDFAVILATVDSDIDSLKRYVDSELNIHRVSTDSDLSSLRYTLDQFTDVVNYGRVYDSETFVPTTITILGNPTAETGLGTIFGTVTDLTAGNLQYQMEASNVTVNNNRLIRHVIGEHKINNTTDSELININFDYVGTTNTTGPLVNTLSYQGVSTNAGGGFFKSATVTWKYWPGAIAGGLISGAVVPPNQVETQTNVAQVNTDRPTFVNPNPELRVRSISIKLSDRSSPTPGANYIQLTGVNQADVFQAERANVIRFNNVRQMLSYPAHPEQVAYNEVTKSVWISNEDSEWVNAHPIYKYVDISVEELEKNFPALSETEGTRALVTTNRYEYYVHNRKWTLDGRSVWQFDSDLFSKHDSDIQALYHIRAAGDSDLSDRATALATSIESLDDRLEVHDSEIVRLTLALNTFYTDYVALKQAQGLISTDVDSDVNALTTYVNNKIAAIEASRKAEQDSELLLISSLRVYLTNVVNNYQLATTNLVTSIKEQHDSDQQVLSQALLANSIDISLLRNDITGKADDNDSDINVLEISQAKQDSDILYNKLVAMKYRGYIDVTSSANYPAVGVFGDVYINTGDGQADAVWTGISPQPVVSGTVVMRTPENGWNIIYQPFSVFIPENDSDSDLWQRAFDLDSDAKVLTRRVNDHDSDIGALYAKFPPIDSDLLALKIRDSELQQQIFDNDSDLAVMRTDVNNLQAGFNLAQYSTTFPITTPLTVGIEYDITAETFSTGSPEVYCFPDVEFFFATTGTNLALPSKRGRILNGSYGTPNVSYRVIHDGAGVPTIGLTTDSEVSNSIQILATYRTTP